MSEIETYSPTGLRREIGRRLSPYIREKIPAARQGEYEDKGWVLDKALKRDIWMRRQKPHDVAFEDRIWAMCAQLGFVQMSIGRSLRIKYGKNSNETKQVDVLAADDEVVLVFECKSSNSEQPRTETFKQEIESIQGYRAGLIGSLRERFPDHKVKFVFATNNIAVSRDTADRIESAGITYLDEDAVSYYQELASHLGSAAKFQLLGNLFSGQQIEAMDSTVAAIQGKLGGHTYYSFAIEPRRLLKIAYVLHNNKANVRWMPTYQRIIKKARLKSVSDFVESGGFFPNSLIVNIDSGGRNRGLRFEKTDKQAGATTLGILHLPRKYRSAYIIDGQHRLYGFANSERADTESIPVVAFIDLPPEKQRELFMQINENQQSVSKTLQNTLNADLLWTSEDKKKQAHALKLKIAQTLGEFKASPMYGRIVIGEEQATDRRCISLDAINRGIDRGRFIGEFVPSGAKRLGSFYRTSNDDTIQPLTDFLILCFEFLRDQLPAQWNLGRVEPGFVFTNAGVEASLRLIGDIVDHLEAAGQVSARNDDVAGVFAEVKPWLADFTSYVQGLTSDEVAEFRTWLGSGAPTKYLRRFQAALAAKTPTFEPEGLADYLKSQEKEFNVESYKLVSDIESFLKRDIRQKLEDEFGASWYNSGVPKKVYQGAQALLAEKQYEAGPEAKIDWWDCLHLIDYRDIVLHGNMALWNKLYDAEYTLPSDRKANSWKDKSSWLVKLNEIRKKVMHPTGDNVSEEEYGFLQALHLHFDLGGTGKN
ncbi:DGQHR domain-containing protein [Salinibacterium sp. dk2585]|uniref:DGQHR domain-containing protein n=1 Tax=unclassified Salinibacterium TaxID=2632331 RepID=UPI0011C24481|nr:MULTISPECIES: DGQHR domain-containing protein [unclassified Salinibacterium]QEE60279.1 DGQHR domain-containing protein [Salinibacterium sp. dk2585]TXK55351.1 DGQHR domain-containing protein [Salinibacterium sp. dk5596]